MTTFEVQIRDGKKKAAPRELETKVAGQLVVDSIYKLIDKGDKRVIIYKASTGIGKSTYMIHGLSVRNPHRTVICSYVTIVNTISIAKYVATLDHMILGTNIGYSTSQEKVAIPGPGILYQTIKTTTAQFLYPIANQSAIFPNHIIVIDEVHTNSLDMQEYLAYVYKIVYTVPEAHRPHFIIYSASIDENDFADYFGTDFVIQVSGSRFPICELCYNYLPQIDTRSASKSIASVINSIVDYKNTPVLASAIQEYAVNPLGSILVFFATGGHIKLAQQDLQIANCPLPVYQVTSQDVEQNPHLLDEVQDDRQKVILATPVIETGFTYERLSFVIDTLKYNMVYYNPSTKASTIRYSPVDMSMMYQRRGRVGRTRAGIYIPLTDQHCLDALKQRKPLSSTYLTDLKSIVFDAGLSNFSRLAFMQAPSYEQLYDVLQFMSFIRYNPDTPGEYFWLLTDSKSKIHLHLKYFVLLGTEQGYRVFDLALIVASVSNLSQFPRETVDALKGKSNYIWELYNFVLEADPLALPEKLLSTAQDLISAFLVKGYDIFVGKRMTAKALTDLALRAFIGNIIILKEEYYQSLYTKNINITDRRSYVVVTDSFYDFRVVQPQLLVDVPLTPQYAMELVASLCKA